MDFFLPYAFPKLTWFFCLVLFSFVLFWRGVDFLRFSTLSIMSSVNNSFTSFQIYMDFILLYFLSYFILVPIALTSTSNTKLIRSDKNGHSCFVIDLTGKALSLSLLSMMWAASILQVLTYQMENVFFCT